MKFLAIVAALVGAAALAATGVGAPAAAAAIGLVASILGAVTAVHNINRRAERRTLAWDAELALDVIGIIGVLPAAAGARLARLGNLPKGVSAIQRTEKFLRIYSTLEAGATVTLVGAKLVEDIQKIEALADRMGLSKQEKQKMVDQAIGGALQTGMMMLGGVVASRAGQTAIQRRMARADRMRLERHAEMAEAEGLLSYESRVEPLLDAQNNPTPAGLRLLEQVAPHAVPKPDPPTIKRKGPIDPTSTAPKQARRKGDRRRRDAPDEVDENAKTGRFRRPRLDGESEAPEGRQAARRRKGDEEPEAAVTEHDRQRIWELEDLGEAAVARLTRPEKITPRYDYEARRAFRDTWMNASGKEIGLYRNTETGEYIIVVGKENAVYVQKVGDELQPPIGGAEQRWKQLLDDIDDVGEWFLVGHSHPSQGDGTVADYGRIPSGASGDFSALIFESQALGGAPRTSHIYFMTRTQTETGAPGKATPNQTEFSYDPRAARPLRIDYPEPGTDRRVTESFADLDEYHLWAKQNFGVDDPPSQRIRNVQRRNREAARQRLAEDAPTRPRFRVPRAPNQGPNQAEGLAPGAKVPTDTAGQLERSTTGPKGEKDRYYVREHLGDTIEVGEMKIPSARYYVDVHLKNGVIEADFMLKHGSYEGAIQVTRSSQLRGRQEFNLALRHFEAANGPDAVKGVRGQWGAGDNFDAFNKNFHKELLAGKDWDQAVADAARDTHTGRWSQEAGFTEVRIVNDSEYDADTVTFNKLEVLFVRPSVGSELGGRPTPPWTGNRESPSPPARSNRADTEPDLPPQGGRADTDFPPGPSPEDTIPDLPPGAPPRPPPPPPGGGGGRSGSGGNGGRRQGFRALSASEADGINPGAASGQTRWDVSRINDRDTYQSAWADTGHPGTAPPHGFIDYDGNRIVAFNRGVDEDAVTQIRRGPRRAAPLPRRRRRRDTTREYPAVAARRRHEATTRPDPAVAGRSSAGQSPSPTPQTNTRPLGPRRRPPSQETTQEMQPLRQRVDTQQTTGVRQRPAPPRTPPGSSGRPRPGAPPARPRYPVAKPPSQTLPAREPRKDATPHPRLPRGVSGLLDWGTSVVRWGGGVRGAQDRLAEIRANPQQARIEMTSQPGRWVTPRLARATQEFYRRDLERVRKLGRRNPTAEARIELMKEVERILEPRSLWERIRDLGRDLSRKRIKTATRQLPPGAHESAVTPRIPASAPDYGRAW